MMPAYRSMDSYPYHRNQMPFSHCYYPGTEAIPPQIKVDPSKSPFAYEQPWPSAGSYGHPTPVHFCCGHNNFPGYYSYRPAYLHAPVPSPVYYYPGGCPAYGEPFSVPYSPQPHYTMELPRYEYDKCMPRDYHCCGCPTHSCHQKDGKSAKIEEHEPDVGKKVNDALVPIHSKYYPYPFVWIPPEYANNRELKNPVTAEVSEQDKISHDRMPPGPGYFRADAQDPRVWNGWLPFDMNSAPNMVHDRDGRRNQDRQTDNNRRESEDGRTNEKHQSEHKRSEFPFPIIWMPYYNKQEEGGRTNNQESTSTPKSIEEVPHIFKSVPVKFYADEGVTIPNQDDSPNPSGPDVTTEVTNEKSIPVKQMELHQGKNDSEGSDSRERNIHVKQTEENMTKKDSHTSVERQPLSPQKTSKLPPVCLRVDPLPRKKNRNGNSRSPSPPASKEHSQATAGEKSKTPSCGTNEKAQPNSNLQNASNISEKVKPKERIVQVSEINISENKGADCRDDSQSHISFSMPSGVSIGTKESCTNGDEYKTKENKAEKGAENMMEEVTEPREERESIKPIDDECRKDRKVFSDVDAAVLIQAAYRGYQVRKWEPLKKLKQIAEVTKEVTDVSGRIQALEASSDFQNDDKQRITIGETIMRLLLKLDTVQGLHPSFREMRKSLARELTSLQEKLDSIMAKGPQQQTQELFAREPVEDTPLNTQNGEYMQGQQEEIVAAPGVDSSEGISHDTLEKCQDQFCMKDGIHSLPADDGGSESQSPIDPASKEVTEPIVLPNGIVTEYVSQVVTVDAHNSRSGLSETDKKTVDHETKSEVEVDNLDVTAWKELPVGVIDEDLVDDEDHVDINSGKDEQNEVGRTDAQLTGFTTTLVDRNFPAMVDDSAQDGVDSEIHAMVELPVGLLDEDNATFQFEKHDDPKISKAVLQAEDAECIAELPVGLLDEDPATSEFEKHDETKTSKGVLDAGDGECIAEVPVGLLDEDTATSEFEKHDETKTSKGVLDAGDGECIAEVPVELLDEDTATSEFEKHDETKISKGVLPAGEGECNANVKTSASTDDTAKETQLEQQLLGKQEEVHSTGESDGWVEIGFQKEDELSRYAPLDIEVEYQTGEEIGNDTKHPSLTTKANGHEVGNGDVCLEMNDVKNIQPETMELVINTQARVPINDLQKEEEPEERVALRETQFEGPQQVLSADAKDAQTLAKEKNELSAASPAYKELPVAEHDGLLNGDTKLLDENKKLRKMMMKLLEAGNEQLTVISDLTGRVKDLEKKLARSKRVKTKRYRPSTSKMSCMKT